jgi:hypothetical protein
MGLSRLDNFLRSIRGTIIFVDPNNLDATDSIDNNGASQVRPFRTIQRALLEASRFSYQRGLDNDRFEKTSIVVYPGEHIIDNRPGWIPEVPDQSDPLLRNFLLRSGVSSNTFFPFDGATNFNLETDNNELYKLNSIYGGVIIPRGVSLVGLDLRKTKIRPRYVPNPENDNIERTAIFRLTGGSFFWNFTVFDALPSGQVYQDYTLNKRLPNYSHNKLTVFEYADGVNPVSISDQFLTYSTDRTDLDMYYEKVSIAYGTASNRSINPTFPESGIDIQAITGEFEIVGSRGEEFIVSNIFSGDGTQTSEIITVELNRPIAGLNVNTAIRIQGVPIPGYNGSFVINEVVNGNTIRYRAATAPLVPNPNIDGVTVILNVVVDTVNSASPYIFNVSLRSVYGMCGIHADGDKADGFKSVVIAQFTGIGLQKDNNAFIKFNPNTGIYDDSTIVPNLSSDSKAIYKPKYENFHIKASNDAFMQLVSVFAIGFAKQFVVESGGDFSVTNSNSNFGAKGLVSSGFKRNSFSQDDTGYITHIIPPRQIESEEIALNFNSIDVALTASVGSSNRLYLYQEINLDNPPENVIDGYRIGAKKGETLSVIINQGGVPQIRTSQIVMSSVFGSNDTSVKTYSVALDGNNLPNINNTTNVITLTTPHDLQTGEKIRVLSSVAFLPNGIETNEIYYAITTTAQNPLDSNQIKLAKSFNDAIGNIPININNNGQFLKIESRVSDKLTGEIGHPIQWDENELNWYITVNSTNNQIYTSITTLGISVLGNSTSRTFFKRTPDDRNLIDTVYRYRYVIPKDSPINARPPVDGFIIQESNDSIGLTNTEIQKYFDINKLSSILQSNPYEIKNFRLIALATWNNGIATFITERPHNLAAFSEVEIKNIKSTPQNLQGLDNKGFNGKYNVISVSNRKTFSVLMPNNPGTFINDTTNRNTQLPFFKRSRYRDTYSIYKKEEIQEYVPGQKDGIYHLFVVTNSISPFVEPFNSLKLSQPIENFYPQKNRDNPNSDPNFAISFALPDPIGKVVVSDVEKSITNESVNRFISDVNIGFGLTDIQSNSNGNEHSIFTAIDHGLNKITRVSIQSGGSGYGTGTGPDIEVFYNAQLVGSSTGEGATAVVKVQNGSITDILLMDGGSGYQVNQVLSVVGIPTTTGFVSAQIRILNIYNNIDSNIKIDGILDPQFSSYNGIYRVTSIPNSRIIEVISDTSRNVENPTGLANINSSILQFGVCSLLGNAIKIINYSYNSNTGVSVITTENSNGLKINNSVIITGFTNNNNFFNGKFFIKKVNTITQFEIFVGKNLPSRLLGSVPNVNVAPPNNPQQLLNNTFPGATTGNTAIDSTTGNLWRYNGTSWSIVNTLYLNRTGLVASGGPITIENEETAGRLSTKYDNVTTRLVSLINDTTDTINVLNFNNIDLKLGDYLIIDYEIMRIREDVTTNSIKVFRGLLGTTKRSHVANSYIERIRVLPIEFRRNSVIRASGHTFEYVGYGPGNYSTTLPERQDRVLSKAEETLAQSFKMDGGINVYTGMNDSGNFYVGNRRIISTTGREEILDAPIPTITGEDPTGSNNFGFDLISPDEIRVDRSIKVEGGSNNNLISEFDGPVVFNNKITTLKNIETSSLSLKGDSDVSRNYTIGFNEPTFSGNPGDIIFDGNPSAGGELGWIFTNNNNWQKFGLIQENGIYKGTFSGTFIGNSIGGGSDIWATNSIGIHTTSNVGIGTITALQNFALHVFGGLKVNGISEFNSQQLTFNANTSINQNLNVIGVSTFSDNIIIRTVNNNTNGRYLRFVQTDTTIINDQGYGGIEWEGFDSANDGIRGYIYGISEGTLGQFALSFATQGSGTSSPEERMRISSNGNVIFRKEVLFEGRVIGIADTSKTIEVTSDTTNNNRFLTFVTDSTTGIRNIRTSSDITYNPSQKIFTTNNIRANGTTESTSTSTGALVTSGGLGVAKNIVAGGNVTINGTTESTSTSTGALVTSGGLGVAKNIVAGGNVTINGTLNTFGIGGISGSYFRKIPNVGNDGVMEIGRYIDFHSTNADTSDFTYRIDNTSNGNLSFSGNITVAGTVTANSDEKLKENVQTIENALDKVKNLRGVEYDRKDSGEHQIGVIAQEVERIIPEVVYGDEIKSVAYGNLVGLLIEAIKDQQNEIDELKKKL